MMMRIIKECDVAGQKVQVKELTVGEIRAWLAGKTEPGDLVDSMLFEELSLSDLPVLTSLSAEAVEALTPAEIDAILPVIREVNGRFFQMCEKAAAIGRRILAEQGKNASATSNAPSPP
jgi:hypothetical protein